MYLCERERANRETIEIKMRVERKNEGGTYGEHKLTNKHTCLPICISHKFVCTIFIDSNTLKTVQT